MPVAGAVHPHVVRAGGIAFLDVDGVGDVLDGGPALVGALRSHVTQGPVTPGGQGDRLPPGMLVVSDGGTVAAMTAQARAWQAVMAHQQAAPEWLIEYGRAPGRLLILA
ncbi:hypothetical protein [Streptomyces sp. NBC_00648]|uniref:hypothetical protein n=1 Tax=Streptomyces sp. NBC_00648 TaxID=2975797 RepID=UPI0032527FB4